MSDKSRVIVMKDWKRGNFKINNPNSVMATDEEVEAARQRVIEALKIMSDDIFVEDAWLSREIMSGKIQVNVEFNNKGKSDVQKFRVDIKR